MHRHGYQGRKFGRERDQRRALLKGLATNLVEHGKIETTLPKAKELVRYIEKLITKAKKGDLANRRAVIAGLNTQAAAFKKTTDEVRAPNRVEQVIAKVQSLAQEHGANPKVVDTVYRAMISAFIEAELKEHSLLNENCAKP